MTGNERGGIPWIGTESHSGKRKRSPAHHATVAITVTLPWTAWLTVRLFGLDSSYPWVPAIAFTPYVAVTALLPLAIAVLIRQWYTVALSTVVAVTFAALVVPRTVTTPQTTTETSGPPLVVLTANLYEGKGDLGVLADLVERNNVDVLTLQEVTPEATETMDTLGLSNTLPHATVDARPGVSGSAVYSRHPAIDITQPGVSETSTFAQPSAEITVTGAPPLEVTSAHPVPPVTSEGVSRWRREMEAIPEATSEGPVRIVAGDFNGTLDHAHVRSLLSSGYQDAAAVTGTGLELTWSRGGIPGLTIDHILADDRVAVEATSVHHVPGSDHRAVLAKLRLPAP